MKRKSSEEKNRSVAEDKWRLSINENHETRAENGGMASAKASALA
jgi:hypothetical protein